MNALVTKSSCVLAALVAGSIAVLACSDDAAPGVGGTPDAGNPDSGKPKSDGGADPGDDDDTDAGDAGKPPREAPVFLAKADYADLITLDPTFPFDVTQVHAADGTVAAAHWGAHGGPLVTTNIYGESGPNPSVLRWTVNAAEPKAAAAQTTRTLTKASDIPAQFFYGADGVVDLPFGPFALLSYSTSASPYTGEALLYAPDYDAVKSRAKVNGFYSGIGVHGTNGDVLVYSGLSALSATASNDSDNGLYAAALCNGALVGAAPCVESHKLFGWEGNSGPVIADAHGNVFVGASLADGDTTDVIYGLTTTQAFSPTALTPPVLAAVDSLGTASLAAVAPEGTGTGWIFGLGYADDAAIYAAPYEETASGLTKGNATIAKAITRAPDVDSLYVFTDGEGDLWLAITKGTKGTFVELRRK